MSIKHPIISVTGSSGSGTTSVRQTFDQIFRREHVRAAFVQGDAFHRYDRCGMEKAMEMAAKRGNLNFSHFGADANMLDELEKLFRTYAENGTGMTRLYVHDVEEARAIGAPIGSFTPWTEIEPETDLLLYEGLHGAVVTGDTNIAQHADLKIGVVPVINLEWIQKIQRDRTERGYTTEEVTEAILRRMPDYVKYICPQFTQTDINFQRIPTVDTSNPFVARWIPTPDEFDGHHSFQGAAWHRFRLSLVDAPRQLYVACQFDRDPRQQARSCDAADLDATHSAARRAPPPRLVT